MTARHGPPGRGRGGAPTRRPGQTDSTPAKAPEAVSSIAPARIVWPPVINRAARIVNSYPTLITLRQLFYRLVSEQLLANSTSAYKRLSELTAEHRRQGRFPALADTTRDIVLAQSWTSPAEALRDIVEDYRRPRTEDQPYTIVLGVEKRGMIQQLWDWFGDQLGIPVVPLAGYDSQSHIDQVRGLVHHYRRPAVLLYAGDFDPSGEDILRDYTERSRCFDKIVHVALTPEQVDEFGLPENPGKITDSRARAFAAKHGRLVQVELDALDPNDLRSLYQAAIDQFWDTSIYEDVRAEEEQQVAEFREFVGRWSS